MKDPCTKTTSDAPRVPFRKLDALWFQVAGTVCNLRCDHCFISCSPENDKFKFLTLDYCKEMLTEGAQLGAKEFYFTGGEPFANPAMCDILEAAAAIAPSTVLTNATLFRASTLTHLKRINESATNAIEMRVSIDGYNAEMNDPIRGLGTFEKAMQGVQDLCEHGFSPIITITRTWDCPDDTVLAKFVTQLESRGYTKPRLKVLPALKLGAEAARTRGYTECERVTHEMMCGFDTAQLVCSSARVVTDQGIWVCPILIDSPDANLGQSLRESFTDYPLRHQACHTCWSNGAICSNAPTPAPTSQKI